MNSLLRKTLGLYSSSSSRLSSQSLLLCKTLASLTSLSPFPPSSHVPPLPFTTFFLFQSSDTSITLRWSRLKPSDGLGLRGFRACADVLSFRATVPAPAEYSVDEPSDEKGDDGLEIAGLGISREIVSALAKKGITKLFPIQRAVLEPAMQGRDMIGRAKTGTGKTLAFGIPIMDKIIKFNAKHGQGRNPLALVMAPTRELARQVEKEFRESATVLDTICVYGGVPISHQINTLNYGVDVVVGTPGRVIDLLKRGALNLSEVQFVVLDESDQMLAVGFEEDVEVILEKLPQKRQSMLFSATMPSWIRKLSQKYLKNPVVIDLVGDSDQKLAEGISLFSIATDMYSKPSVLGHLVTEHAKGGKCIVFTQTKRDADRLAYSMSRSFRCEALHGDISQNQRERTLSGFRDGRFNILVATDVAARGLDIPNVDVVIHYELPNSSEIFVHRSGRTGRAGKKGSAILMYTQQQSRAVRVIEQDVGCRFSELPRVSGESGSRDILGDFGGSHYGSSFGGSGSGRLGGSGFNRSENYDNSRFGRSGGYGRPGFDRASGFGSSPGHFGRYDDSQRGRSGDSNMRKSGDFGRSGFGRPGNFSDSGLSRFDGAFRDSSPNSSGNLNDSSSRRFGQSASGRFGSLHGLGDEDDRGSGRDSF